MCDLVPSKAGWRERGPLSRNCLRLLILARPRWRDLAHETAECLGGQHGGPGNDAGPGCRFADFDTDTDLRDFAEFQVNFTGGE